MLFAFDVFLLDSQKLELLRHGRPVSVQPKVFKLLLYLVVHRGRCVTGDELLREVWRDEVVSPASVTSAVRSARKVLGDQGTSQAAIRTVRGLGYRFVLPVTEVPTGSAARDVPAPKTTTSEAPPPAPSPGDALFVGRAGVFAALDDALAALGAGRGCSLLLSGEPGIGKTRTLHAVAAHARAAGARVWFARCLEGDGAPPFWPLVQLVREAAEDLGALTIHTLMGSGAADVAQAIPALRDWLPNLSDAPGIASSAARFRFFDSFATFLRRTAARGPLVLLFDDLQQADEPTARLLAFLAQQLERTAVLVVGAMRPVSHHAASRALQRDLAVSPASVSIELRGLSKSEIAHYIAQRVGAEPPRHVVSELFALTAGNPLYLQQLLYRMSPADAPVGDQTWTKLVATADGHGVQTAIARQIDLVSTPCKELLQTASVLGRDFAFGLLIEVWRPRASPEDRERALLLLAEARDCGLVTLDEARHHRFRHALIRDALYARIAPHERARLHQRAALTLEAGGAGASSALLAQMADHFFHAAAVAGHERALHYLMRAAQDATDKLAYEEAAAHVDRALEVLDLSAPDRVQRLALLLAKSEALSRATLRSAARAVLLEAASLARELGDVDGVLQAVTLLARPPETGVADATRISWLRDALGLLDAADPRRIELQALLAKSLSYSTEIEASEQLARAALASARTLPALAQRAETLLACHEALAGPQHLRERVQISAEVMSLGRRLGDSSILLRATTTQVWNGIERGDMVAVEHATNALEALATGVREPFFKWYATMYRAMRATVQGRLELATRLAQEALELGTLIGQAFAEHAHAIQHATILFYQGRLVEAEVLVRGFSARYPMLAGWRATLGVLHANLGHHAYAREVLEELVADDARALRGEPYFLGSFAPAADLCALVGDAAIAARLYQDILPYEAHCGNIAFGQATHGPMSRHLGLLALRMGDLPRALTHLRHAIEASERMQSPPHLSLSYASFAVTLAHGKTAAALAEARQALKRAASIAEASALRGIRVLCANLEAELDAQAAQPAATVRRVR